MSRAKAPGNPSLSPRERRPGLYRERVPFRKVRGQGRCHPSTLSPSSSSCHKMELRSHISLPTHRGARIEPRPTDLDGGHLPLPSSTSATPSPAPASSHQRPPGENLSDSLLAPGPPPPGSSQRCRNRTPCQLSFMNFRFTQAVQQRPHWQDQGHPGQLRVAAPLMDPQR